MSRVRLYVDEDAADKGVVAQLRTAGFDVLTAHEAATEGDSDQVQLEFAAAQGRTLYTLNTDDFARLHAQLLANGGTHAGIITIPEQRYGVGEKLRRLTSFLNSVTAEEMVNRIEYL
ncbi:MAG: DUF5615 family PIN-like protein [Pirellulales bacterium]|nr:DUF5615 family PIN-like protein [Pirellulales bacterium]